MRLWMAVLLMTGVLLAGAPARAECDIGGLAVPCDTRNGEYRIRKPAGTGPFPTVIYLYGSLGNSKQKINETGFVQAFVERGYAVIVPAALNLRYQDGLGSGWHLRHERGRKQRNEVEFIREVIRDAEITHNIDRNRILIAGMSRGAFLAWEIACHDPGLAAAYAPIAGGYLGPMPNRCARPVRLLHTHGRADQIVPINPDSSDRSGGARYNPVSETVAKMARSSGCIEAGRPTKFREYERVSWKSCGLGGSVDLLLHDGAHTIPYSWYSVIVDWFEGEREAPVTAGGTTGGAQPKFRRAGQGFGTNSNGTSRFKRVKP